MLAVCGGGGNDTLAALLILAAIVIGPLAFLVPEAASDDFVQRAVVALALTSASGLAVAWATWAVHPRPRALRLTLGKLLRARRRAAALLAILLVGTGCIS